MADRTLADGDPEIAGRGEHGPSWLEELGAPERVERIRSLTVEGEALRAHLVRWVGSTFVLLDEFEDLLSGRGLSPASHESFARLSGVDRLHLLAEEMTASIEALAQR